MPAATNPGSGSPRRPKRPASSSPVRSQGQLVGAQLVDSLNGLVEDLIKENRRLQKQVEKLSSGGAGTAAAGLERGLKAIQKRIERTLASTVGKPAAPRSRAPARSKADTSTPARRRPRKPDA